MSNALMPPTPTSHFLSGGEFANYVNGMYAANQTGIGAYSAITTALASGSIGGIIVSEKNRNKDKN